MNGLNNYNKKDKTLAWNISSRIHVPPSHAKGIPFPSQRDSLGEGTPLEGGRDWWDLLVVFITIYFHYLDFKTLRAGIIHYSFLLSLSLLYPSLSHAQSYFKKFESSQQFFNQKIIRFSNGDVLIGDSASASSSNGARNGTVYLSRIDPCGNILWSYAYVLPTGFLEFKDFKTSSSEKVIVYGSYYGPSPLQEFIFLLKIDGKTGVGGDYQLFSTGAVDRFAYSLGLKNDGILIYGLLLGSDFEREGFVALFDHNLRFLWAKKFRPFDTTGAAIVDKNGSFMGWSSKYLMKFDAQGATDWAVSLESDLHINIIGGPLEVSDGFLFEGHRQGRSFFYKVSTDGRLVWKTDFFSATRLGAAMSLLHDGNVLCTYSCSKEEDTRLCQLMLAPDGKIFNQKQLTSEYTINVGTLYQSIHPDGTITIAGNADPFMIQATDVKNFIAQFAADDPLDDCMLWEDFQDTSPNDLNPSLVSYDMSPHSFDMVLEENISTDTLAFHLPLEQICPESMEANLLQQDTSLACGEDWLVSLPNTDFEWIDGNTNNPRIISIPGVYKAQNSSCVNPISLHYILEKEICECQVYLPNAFSPNKDGINDELRFFSDCELEKVEFSIFTRWGDRLFYTTDLNHFWDGMVQQKRLDSGVYVAMLKYQWIDFDENVREGILVQDVTLF